MIAEVTTLYETNARSIPDMLRQAAASIESEASDEECSPTKAMVAVQIAENGQVQIYGWGETDDLHALGLLERGKHELMRSIAEVLE